VSSWAQQVLVQVQERVHNKLVQEQVLDQDHNWVQVQVLEQGQVLVLPPNSFQSRLHLATIQVRIVLRLCNTSYRRSSYFLSSFVNVFS
jgi:hypothetical protein